MQIVQHLLSLSIKILNKQTRTFRGPSCQMPFAFPGQTPDDNSGIATFIHLNHRQKDSDERVDLFFPEHYTATLASASTGYL